MAANFIWTPDGPLPQIYEHTRCKLDVIRRYLDVYFDTLAQDPRIDRINISLVDGFCGGGLYNTDDGHVHGSPLVLLEAVRAAEQRINQGRRKRLTINARYYFIDAEQSHILTLKKVLKEQGCDSWLAEDQVTFLEGKFEDHLPAILGDIRARQTAGRSVFLLDQCGYSDVSSTNLQRIIGSLTGAEVILTFAIDGLLNYLSKKSLNNDQLRSLGITHTFLRAWRERNGSGFTRPLAQRTIMNNLRGAAGFMTPFILHSEGDHRDMALIHLSNHQMARNKMLGLYWAAGNSFKHCGKGSLYTLGFDNRFLETGNALFSFDDNDQTQMKEELLIDLPARIHETITDGGLPVSDLLNLIGNLTAARNEDMFEIIRTLVSEGEFSITSPDGKQRRPATLPQVGDVIKTPAQKTIFPMLRKDDN